jgi:hypothetical protein
MTDGHGHLIVNRTVVSPDRWEHLPRLRIELNNKEYEDTLIEYKFLYQWHPSDNKWVLREKYREHWGKE